MRRAFGVFLFVSLSACGGRQEAPAEVEVEEDALCCFDERWATPPPEIGQTPPEREAPDDALEPFVPDDAPAPE